MLMLFKYLKTGFKALFKQVCGHVTAQLLWPFIWLQDWSRVHKMSLQGRTINTVIDK